MLRIRLLPFLVPLWCTLSAISKHRALFQHTTLIGLQSTQGHFFSLVLLRTEIFPWETAERGEETMSSKEAQAFRTWDKSH